jgi:hypothetical protein
MQKVYYIDLEELEEWDRKEKVFYIYIELIIYLINIFKLLVSKEREMSY